MIFVAAIGACPPPAVLAAETPAPPDGAAEYRPTPQHGDGANLALSVEKLRRGFDPDRPFLIWAVGSSYTNFLGNGDPLIAMLRERYPEGPEIVYKKQVGNSAPWRYVRGWVRHLVIPDQPDVVLIYTIGRLDELEKLLVELRRHTTADVVIPSIHWRRRGKPLWGNPDAAPDQDVPGLRALCEKYGVEFVENRRAWARYVAENELEIDDLLVDTVHQSPYGARIINMNIAAHFRRAEQPACDPRSRQRRVEVEDAQAVRAEGAWSPAAGGTALQCDAPGAALRMRFQGNRVDLVGRSVPGGGRVEVLIDGKPAGELPVFYGTYIQPDQNNAPAPPNPPRDRCPHAVTLGREIVPQSWTITMTSDAGDYELVGSVTGPDGRGNAKQPFTSDSGQILIDPALWRMADTNRAGDRFTFDVYRCAAGEVDFRAAEPAKFRRRLAENLKNGRHTLELVVVGGGPVCIDALEVFEPPLR